MNMQVIGAVFRRNFSSYFSTPTGYVFICLFVFLSSYSAFWSAEFFANNLANLDQLNIRLPWIMLVFIPAITMGIWAEERRQGTDELLLTLPAGDLDVVIGKFLSTVAIYTASLLFSMVSVGFVMWVWLGTPDWGLFLGNYFGYWLVGVAMLSIGMVASFLTSNLTVAFILGALFNFPLVAIGETGVVGGNSRWAQFVSQFSISSQFRDFGQGVISLTSISYFLMITVVSLYLCLVLMGRRHWLGGRDGHSLLGHFVVRAIALAICALALNVVLSQSDARIDVSKAGISKLSRASLDLIAKLDAKNPVVIDAYASPEVPENLVQTRITFLNMLREIQSAAGKKVIVNLHEIDALDPQAELADKSFGITPRTVQSRSASSAQTYDVFMGAAVNCGLEKATIPFLNNNAPVEYELVQAISVVSKQDRKKIGILATDADLFGGMDPQTFSNRPKSIFVTELEKQYTVEKVDATTPITGDYAVLVAVQPSTLSQPQMDNFIAAVKAGQRTAIFEDPMPMFSDVPGTAMPKQPPRNMGMMGMPQQPPTPKGDIKPLWQFLGVDWTLATGRDGKPVKTSGGMFGGGQDQNDFAVIWQDYLPYPKLKDHYAIYKEWVFIDKAVPKVKEPTFNPDDSITSGLQELLFFYPGAFERQTSVDKSGVKIKFTPLVRTGPATGTAPSIETAKAKNARNVMDAKAAADAVGSKEIPTQKQYVLAAKISRPVIAKKEVKDADSDANGSDANGSEAADKGAKETDAKGKDAKAKALGKDEKAKDDKKKAVKPTDAEVVLVADIDMVSDVFFSLRAEGEDDNHWNFDNVPFVLNIIDELAGDEQFVEIRKRKPEHPRLDRIESRTADARQQALDAVNQAEKKRDEAMDTAKDEMEKINKDFQKKLQEQQNRGELDFNSLQIAASNAQASQLATKKKFEQSQRDTDDEFKKSRDAAKREENSQIRNAQQQSKLWAILLPPIPPLLVAFFVFFGRRAREQEGVSRDRLR